MTPSKAEQVAEAAARSASSERLGVIPSLNDADAAAGATDNGGDPAGPAEVVAPVARAAEAAPAAPPVRQAPPDRVARDDIVARFRAQRAERDAADKDAVDDLADFTNGGVPPEMLEADPADAEEPAAAEVDPADVDPVEPVVAPKRKLKVRGAEVELTQDEIEELARKQLAADDYFDESKNKAREASELLRQAQEYAQRVGITTSKPPAGGIDTPPTEPAEASADAVEPHDDIYARTVERIQLGETADAATALRDLIRSEASVMSKEGLEADQLAAETSRSVKTLTDFRAANSDLANDRKASAAIEAMVYELQRADLQSIGVSEDKLPQNPAEIARWHHWYRAKHPDRVKTFNQLLVAAKDDVVAWRKPADKPEQPVVRIAPRVEVTVDRTARRATIQPQPSRTAQSRPPASRQVAAEPDRSAVVQQMIAARAKARQPMAR